APAPVRASSSCAQPAPAGCGSIGTEISQRTSCAAPAFGATIVAGGGWRTPHPGWGVPAECGRSGDERAEGVARDQETALHELLVALAPAVPLFAGYDGVLDDGVEGCD